MALNRTLLGVALLLLAGAAPVRAEDDTRALRRGFTLGSGVCAGWDRTDVFDLSGTWEHGHQILTLSLGAFVNPDLAIGYRSGGLYSESRRFDAPRRIKIASNLHAIYAESWRYAPFKLLAGLGVATLDSDALLADLETGDVALDLDFGWGFDLGAYAPLLQRGRHRIEFGVEWRTMMFDHAEVHQLSLHLGYQLF